MKRSLLSTVSVLICAFSLQAQGVTQLNNDSSLFFNLPLSNAKQLFVSRTGYPWVTDGTPGGTIPLSTVIKFVENIGNVTSNGKLLFAGTTAALDTELYITDGTPAGTKLVRDINVGALSSNPQYLATLNGIVYFTADSATLGNELWRTDGTPAGTTLVKDINPGAPGSAITNFDVAFMGDFVYFTAETALQGRELWRTNGTTAGTTLVKDIVPGTGGSNYPGRYELSSAGISYLLFMARTPASGVELWISDGTAAGTVLLKDINAGADSSNARSFIPLNGIVLFEATDATHGDELWRTDGTPGGTTILKDINPTGSSTQLDLGFGFSQPVYLGIHIFKNLGYFNAYNGTSAGQVWSTDGTTANTILVKDIVPGASIPLPSVNLGSAINLTDKFIFPVSDGISRSELWECNGTPAGTVLFKSFALESARIPAIFSPNTFTSGSANPVLFQGNKFFFSAGTDADGYELWISDGVDGTATHTHIVKDINPGTGDSDPGTPLYLYTTTTLFFPANDGTHGFELWRSDGTTAGTDTVKDLNPGIKNANPFLDPFSIVNGKILFIATEGSDSSKTDLYAVGGTFTALPVKLTDFTVALKNKDALLEWSTTQELNTKSFTIRRSYDAQHFDDIGIVQATGTSSNRHAYSFTDPGISNSGKSIVYYRLLSTDIDGKSENSNVISLKLNGNNKWDVHLLSNPVPDNVNVILSGTTGNVRLSIHDISGKTIYTKSLQNINGQISLPATLQKGIYILEAENNNERKSIKFVK